MQSPIVKHAAMPSVGPSSVVIEHYKVIKSNISIATQQILMVLVNINTW